MHILIYPCMSLWIYRYMCTYLYVQNRILAGCFQTLSHIHTYVKYIFLNFQKYTYHEASLPDTVIYTYVHTYRNVSGYYHVYIHACTHTNMSIVCQNTPTTRDVSGLCHMYIYTYNYIYVWPKIHIPSVVLSRHCHIYIRTVMHTHIFVCD